MSLTHKHYMDRIMITPGDNLPSLPPSTRRHNSITARCYLPAAVRCLAMISSIFDSKSSRDCSRTYVDRLGEDVDAAAARFLHNPNGPCVPYAQQAVRTAPRGPHHAGVPVSSPRRRLNGA